MPSATPLLERIAGGRTDLVFDYLASGHSATETDAQGISLMQHCAYYGDVSAIRYLLANGAPLKVLGEDLGLVAACLHGHWRLVEFLLEQGAGANYTDPDTGETLLHAALSTTERIAHNRVMRVLLAHGADPNRTTRLDVETGGFMRDVRTCGETPLHRAAAFGDEEAIRLLLTSARRSTRKTRTVIRRSAGRVGTCVPTPSCACSYTATFASIRSAPACASTCRAIRTNV